MENYKIGFLILHYLVIDDTIKCVESILNRVDTDNYEIVIVDNASYNNTGLELINIYKNYKNIHIILNKHNLGFARGNNIGFEYLKNKLNCGFIVMLNNDTYIIQDDFYQTVVREYHNSRFGILGPKIILPDGKVPMDMSILDKDILKKIIKVQYFILFLNYLYIGKLFKYISKIKNLLIPSKNKKHVEHFYNRNTTTKNMVIHGCCIVFSPKYLNLFNGIDDRTFMFKEEELLYLRLIKNNLISIYNPELLIFHSEDRATNEKLKRNRDRNIFIYKNQIKSNKILLSSLNHN